MNRRFFLFALAAAAFAAPLAQAQSRDDMRKRWDEMDHGQREHAMDRMRGRRSEPSYEQMRDRWDKMSPETRQKMMARHDRMHENMRK